ncbi:uncharacterized protein AFUA_3G06350 [Aspergillus fumigatus Af293]|jgi:hypothetical protein|uniref:Uncharacterized protein n=2 Tax=Aspergillus fumigatus TaxID=746128 RepID=Q4WWM0_ASPFU|nr:hypothetical protein AFUA_3G06350 [Aspergillus fumigatus Af293]EAL92933.1 hypothetical protein AFUA_3G06350 [Aspergillus fumigatus Af293]EDP53100.1 hypothetical protein AFUB_042710 [Aspergillus fumigatus A1163]
MFYSGGLQEGISLAVTERKAVVCFVRGLSVIPRTITYDATITQSRMLIDGESVDDEENSNIWEEEYFKDDEVNPSMMAIAVVWLLTPMPST